MSPLAELLGPPPLTPFGLRLHHDGRFTHDGRAIENRRLREHFDRSVEYLPEEQKFIVRLKHFRAEVEVEEAGFFVRSLDRVTGEIQLSDGSREALDVSTLRPSTIDGALLCRIKSERVSGGLLARFSQSTQAEFASAIEVDESGHCVRIAGKRQVCPEF